MFDPIIGNDQLKQDLRRLRRERRVPNSILFAGPEGVGKRLFAMELARSFVCRISKDLPCGECSACLRVDRFVIPDPEKENRPQFERVFFGEHLDVGIVIPYKRFVLVDAIRDLEFQAHFRPREGDARVFIIDNADQMNDAASNALLKTLEEPADTSYLILIASRPDSLLSTIRSRCQTFRFTPVSAREIEHFLVTKHAFDRTEASLAARISRGSVGRSLAIDVTRFRDRRERMLAVVSNAIETGDRAALLRLAEEANDVRNKEHFEEELEILETLIHDIWTICVNGPVEMTINIDLGPRLEPLAEAVDAGRLAKWLGSIQTLRDGLAVNINRKVATDALFVGMAG